MRFVAVKRPVHNRGVAPDSFLSELIAWAENAPADIFNFSTPREEADIYDAIRIERPDIELRTVDERRAAMCEVLRVLAGFESSWNWDEGGDMSAPRGRNPDEIEAGIFQVSSNSLNFDESLKALYQRHGAEPFGELMRRDHVFALEYTARLLRFTLRHHGPIVRTEIFPWMSTAAIDEFLDALDEAEEVEFPPIPIVLDPGHGDHDSGAVARGLLEKDVVLDVSNHLFRRLSVDPRFAPMATRMADTFLSLGARADMANRHKALLISIHANFSNGQGTGFEVFTFHGQSESDLIATQLFASFATAFPGMVGRADNRDGDPDKEASFAVLRQTEGPAVLFELGFLDHVNDAMLLGDPDTRERMAEALYRGLLNYFDLPELAPENSDSGNVPDTPEDWPPREDIPRIAAWVNRRILGSNNSATGKN